MRPDCVAYVRVSTERQAGEVFTSLADQRTAIEALAARLNRTVARWYADEGVSGATADRPAFAEMLADCEANPRPARAPGYVLILNDSRFGRFPDPDQAAALRFRFSESGWRVRFVENDESDDPSFRPLMRAIGSVGASEYRRQIQRNAKRGAKGTADQGFWNTRAPLGFRRAVVYPPGRERVLEKGVRKADDEKVRLTLGPDDEVACVRWLFETYAHSAGMTLYALTRDATQRWPVLAKWSVSGVREVLRNPAYVGDVVAGRRPSDKHERAVNARRPADQWYGKRNAHPALVSRAVFAAVAARLATNASRPRSVRGTYPLSGIVRCAVCGGRLVGNGAAGARRAGDTGSYTCGTRRSDAAFPGRVLRCDAPHSTISRGILEPAVIGIVRAEVARPVTRARIVAAVDRQLAALRAPSLPARALEKARRTVADLESQRDRLVRLIATGALSEDDGRATLATLRQELAAATAERDRAETVVESGAGYFARIAAERDAILALIERFDPLTTEATGAELRALLAPWIVRATFDGRVRTLTITVRHVPAMSTLPEPMIMDSMPRHAARKPAETTHTVALRARRSKVAP